MVKVRTALIAELGSPTEIVRVCQEIDVRATVIDDPESRVIVAFPSFSNSPSLRSVVELASAFSSRLNRPVLATSRGTPDLLWLGLFEAGSLMVDYDSAYQGLPWTDYAKRLATAFSRPDHWSTVRFALKSRLVISDRHRHWLIVKSLDLPTWIPRYPNAQIVAGQTALHQEALDIRTV